MEEQKDPLRIYDYIVVGFFADISAGIVMAILGGQILAAHLIPILVIAWFSYENFRLWMERKNDSK
jgi:O-antigen ligase